MINYRSILTKKKMFPLMTNLAPEIFADQSSKYTSMETLTEIEE